MQSERLIIFDTTLRDGEQCPGASLNKKEKLEIARQLALLNVDVIEAGFPIASPGDFESVELIAKEVRGPSIAGLARALPKDIEAAARSLEQAEKSRIHIFLSTSKTHRDFKLQKDKSQVIQMAVVAIKPGRKFCDDTEFSPEDASRTEPDFLKEVVEAVIDAGATTVNIPDTVGYSVPEQFGNLIASLKTDVPNIDKAVISVHCHNDLGMAVANSLAAVKAGARQVECTINGIGERAGNAAMEEIVMALRTRQDFFGLESDIDTKHIMACSRLVSSLTGFFVQRNKAIVGRNAFAHESGIHQDGMLKERSTYEIMSPEEVGFAKTDLVLGKHSGRAALADRAKTLGFHLEGDELMKVFEQFKILADKKKEIYDGDIIALVQQQISTSEGQTWSLVDYEVTSAKGRTPSVRLTLSDGSEEKSTEVTEGDGPIDAAFWAVEEITGVQVVCKDYRVRSATLGRDAIGEVNVEVEHQGKLYRGVGVSTDSVESTILAMLNAINRISAAKAANS